MRHHGLARNEAPFRFSLFLQFLLASARVTTVGILRITMLATTFALESRTFHLRGALARVATVGVLDGLAAFFAHDLSTDHLLRLDWALARVATVGVLDGLATFFAHDLSTDHLLRLDWALAR